MDVENLAKELILKNMTPEQQMAVLDSIKESVAKAKEVQKRKIGENVDLVVQALKKIEEDIRSRYDDIGNAIEKRVASIKDGRDGIDGRDGKDGKDGKQGKEGRPGRDGKDGKDGLNGVDGQDGVSVVNAHIDFDGSLVIHLSSGKEINVGEVVAQDLAEKIKVITNGGGTSQVVLDTLASLQTQIDDLIPSQSGQSGKFLTTDGSVLSWSSVAGGLSYQGTWNASTNTPTLASSVGINGYYYIVSTAGSTNLDGITDWQIGDWLMFNGTIWQKIDQSNLVTSVNGQTGAVSLTTTNINEGTNLYYLDSRARQSLSAGTGISYSTSTGVITNSSPDQTVSLTGAGTTSISGTYPSFTITSNDQYQGTVTSVTGTSPIVSSGGNTPAISIPQATSSVNGYLSSTDWSTFNNKGNGTVTSVAQSFTGGLISVSGSPVTSSGTLALAVAGTSGGIPYFSSASTWASSAALAANALVIGGGAGVAPSTITTGTNVLTALGVNVGTAGAFVVNGGALGTPSSGTVTNLTGTASISINGTVGATTPNTGAFTTLSSSSLTIGDAVASGYTGFKNKIIGGDFTTNPWQRGTSFAAWANAEYGADRFLLANTSAGVATLTKTADAPTAAQAGIFTQHCFHVDVTTADASIAAGDLYAVGQLIEGYNAAPFGFGQSGTRYVTLSFWHKHTKTGTYCVSFRNSASDRSYVAEYTQDVTDTWEKATVTFAVDTSGTWLYNNGIGLRVFFAVACGSTRQTTAGAWATGNYFATSNQVNALDSTANNFKIALVQLEAGQTATSFETRSVGQELALCQRYYFRASGNTNDPLSVGFNIGATQATCMTTFQNAMRTAPTALEQTGVATDYKITNAGDTTCSSVPSFLNATQNMARTMFTVASGLTAGYGAVIRGTTSNVYLAWSAEL